MIDLGIKNGIVVTPQGLIRGGLSIDKGRILQVGADELLPDAKQVIDARGLIVFPGIIDPHQHLGIGPIVPNEAKFTADVESVSVSAALGGVTTLHSTMADSIENCKEIASNHSIVDFKFTEAIYHDDHISSIPGLVKDNGITSFKFPLGYIGPEGEQFGALMKFDMGTVYRGFEAIARVGPPALAMIHAEEASIIAAISERLKAEGRKDLKAWSEARPNFCETVHVFECGMIARELNCPLYVVHVSARESVEVIAWLKKMGVPIIGETTPHYLAPFTKDSDVGLIGKVNPPFRDWDDCDELWKGLADGTLGTIGSDNCVYQRKDKEENGIWDSIAGFSGTGAILPIMVTEGIHKNRITWERMAQVCSENVARAFGIYPQKGILAPGSDADIVIVDPNKEWVMGVDTLRDGSDFSIYEGRFVKGKAVYTFVRGKIVAKEGEAVIDPPHGCYVDPQIQYA